MAALSLHDFFHEDGLTVCGEKYILETYDTSCGGKRESMYRYTVQTPENVPRITVANYVYKAFPMLSPGVLRDVLAARDVKINGVRAKRDERVPGGAEVAIYTPQKMSIPVLYEDERLLALDKPSGVSTDADAYGSMTVLKWAELYAEGKYQPRLCHRLDNQTGGVLLIAKEEETEQALKEMFARRSGEKEYACLVRGEPRPASADCVAYLKKDPVHACVQISAQERKDHKRIETSYQTLKSGRVSLLRVQLHTGRTHQIRAHLAYLGYPIVGDDLYGDRALNKRLGIERLQLCAVRMRIDTCGRIPDIDGKEILSPKINELKFIFEKVNS